MSDNKIITKEIDIKGKCYIVCNNFENKSFLEISDKLCLEAHELNAEKIYYTCKNNQIDLDFKSFETENFTFELYTDMDILIKNIENSNGKYNVKMINLSEDNKCEYIKYHNQSFFDVPNSMTLDDEEIKLIFETEAREAGLLYCDNAVIGTYELDFSDKIPEIAAISINRDFRQKGYGRSALQAVEEYLLSKGNKEVFLRVASINKSAYSLYEKTGYKFQKRTSRWFLASKKI